MIIAIAYCQKDQSQAERLAQWMAELGPYPNHRLLVARDKSAGEIDWQGFASVERITVTNDAWNRWPESCNNAFQIVARHIENTKPEPWLWIESDVCPIHADWIDKIEAEYYQAKKPFLGAFVSVHTPELDVPDHGSGVAVYPGTMTKHAGLALISFELAWDVAAKDQILPKLHKTNLIVHNWLHPPFKDQSEVDNLLSANPEMVLFHSSKDGSLIDLLRARMSSHVGVVEDSSRHQSRHSADVTSSPTSANATPTCDILIKSYPKDYEWLSYCLRAIDKFASGFRHVVLIVPKDDPPLADMWGIKLKHRMGIKVHEVVEAGDPYLYQQAIKASAHEFTDADYVLHIDSDVILTKPITPESFFHEGKPIWYMTPYENTETPWKSITEKFIGDPVPYEFMRRFPIICPRKLHLAIAAFCMVHHRMRLTDYILSQTNKEFSEFNALGALAYSRAREDFHWIDTTKA